MSVDSIYVLALQRSLIILVGLTMACFSEKMMISCSCISTYFHAQLAQKILNGTYRGSIFLNFPIDNDFKFLKLQYVAFQPEIFAEDLTSRPINQIVTGKNASLCSRATKCCMHRKWRGVGHKPSWCLTPMILLL